VGHQRIHTLIRWYKQTGTIPFLHPSGRKTILISDKEISLIPESYALFSLGHVLLEKKIEIDLGIHIPHNTIYRVLLCHGLIEVNMRKPQQKKWVRYERKHSMSLWQGVWKAFEYDGTHKWVIAFKDNSFRLITCYGVVGTPTTENTLSVLLQGFAVYGVPRENLTAHDTQFVSARDRENAQHTFKAFLELNGIKHIVARINHQQTNGQIERFFGEVERRIGKLGSVDRIVKWQNEINPHMNLNYQMSAKVFWYRLPSERIRGFVKEWFYV